MDFNQDFLNDINEAYEYWRSKQPPAPELQETTPQQWIASIVARTIYTIIAEKRIHSPQAEDTNAEEKGRQGQTDAH
jgi:hypothetical protein